MKKVLNLIKQNKSFSLTLLVGVLLAIFVWQPLIAGESKAELAVKITPTPTQIPTPTDTPPEPESINVALPTQAPINVNNPSTPQVSCPDGYGGYVVESNESCKARWENISKNAAELMKQSGQLRVDSYNAYGQSLIDQPGVQIPTVSVPTPVQFNPNVNMQITDPTPTPCLKTSTGEIIGLCN